MTILILGRPNWSMGQITEADASPDPWMARDKVAHFAVSLAAVGFSNHLLGSEFGSSKSGARNKSVCFSLSLGVCKEIHDRTQKGNRFSLKDLAADILGTAVGLVLFTGN